MTCYDPASKEIYESVASFSRGNAFISLGVWPVILSSLIKRLVTEDVKSKMI